jgi:hypothetical protein
MGVKTASIWSFAPLRIRQDRVEAWFPEVDWDQPRIRGAFERNLEMADVAVIGILMVSMGFVMWIGQLLTGMVSGAGDGSVDGQ